MIEVLKALKNEFNALDIPYSYDEWGKDVELPYFIGELSEITTNDEDGKREFSFILTGEDVDTYTNLYICWNCHIACLQPCVLRIVSR